VASLRELREGDADDVVALFRAVFGDERSIDAQQVVSWVRSAAFKPEWLQVLELRGRVVGYGDVVIDDKEVALDAAAAGHWETFFEWAEEQARASGVPRVRTLLPAGHETEALVQLRGYRLWRSNYTMHIDLDERAPEAPGLREGIELRSYVPRDEDVLRSTINEVFADDPHFHEATPESFREFSLGARGFDQSLWLLAWDGTELAGCVLAFPERAGETGLGWIESLAVRRAWRRRGLGEALLRAAFSALHAQGLRCVGLGVDTANETGALRLYERVGMRAVRQGNNWVRDV
jgi:ribosomal protein S18 acetylase RimI-like enzyme